MCLILETCIAGRDLSSPKIIFGKMKKIIAYKIVEKIDENKYKPIYQGKTTTRYVTGNEAVSNRKEFHKSTRLDAIERKVKKVYNGIHVFLNRGDAERQLVQRNKKNEVIIAVECKKSSLVSSGYWSDYPFHPQAVFNKVKVLGEINYIIDINTHDFVWGGNSFFYVQIDLPHPEFPHKKCTFYLARNQLTLSYAGKKKFSSVREAVFAYRRWETKTYGTISSAMK